MMFLELSFKRLDRFLIELYFHNLRSQNTIHYFYFQLIKMQNFIAQKGLLILIAKFNFLEVNFLQFQFFPKSG